MAEEDFEFPPGTEALPPISVTADDPKGNPTGQNEGQYSSLDRPDLVRIDPATGMPEEVCVIIVNGTVFDDWETVWIQWSWTSLYSTFKVTCAEREPYPAPTSPLFRIFPGDMCQILLGGILVISGVVEMRQVAYDANNHGIMFQGVSWTWFASMSSIEHKSHDFDGKTFLQIADEILTIAGAKYKTKGNIDQTPFKAGARPGPGEKVADFLDRLARDRKIIVSNTPDGNFLFIGTHGDGTTAELREGENIKKMQCIFSDLEARSKYIAQAEKRASDESNGKEASEQEVTRKGRLKFYNVLITALEHPVETIKEVALRNDTEVMWRDYMDSIQATVTVYGWFRPARSYGSEGGKDAGGSIAREIKGAKSHTLWMAGDEVLVYSPMCPLNQVLKIHTVTWQQSRSAGTETVLLLVNPAGLNSEHYTPAGASQENTQAAATPEPAATFNERWDALGLRAPPPAAGLPSIGDIGPAP